MFAPEMTHCMNHPRRFIWIALISLLLYFGLRLHNIDAIPLFIDETFIIVQSGDIVQDILIQHARDGKFALPYYLLPFQPQVNAVWISRAALLILTCIGFAAEMSIAWRFGGTKAGSDNDIVSGLLSDALLF